VYARSTTVEGDPQAMDDGIAYVRDEVAPLVGEMDGYVGISMICDRRSGRCIVTSTWASEETRQASAAKVGTSRSRWAEILRADTPVVHDWEVAAMHRVRETPDDACVRLIWGHGERGRLQQVLGAWRTTIPAQLEQIPGFCAVSTLIDRTTGRAVSAVAYENREAMERSSEQALVVRDRFAASQDFAITDVAEYDVALAHLRIPETV
jgi:heme-degrading monooxygenase HmoA